MAASPSGCDPAQEKEAHHERNQQGCRDPCRHSAGAPREAFQRTPARAWLILLFNTVIAGCMVVVLAYDLAWYWMLLVALILGHHFFAMGIMSHDIMHGATLKNRSLRRLVSYFGFYPFLISPRLWDVWHNKAHHGRTNTTHDPDANLTVAEAERNAIARFGVHLMPSSRNRILGIVFYTTGLRWWGR